MSQARLSHRCLLLLAGLSLFTLLLLTTTYAAASTISGVIKNGAGVAASGLSVGLYQGDVLQRSATTNAEGRYHFLEVADGGWLVRPVHTGKTFDPVYRYLTVPPDVTTANFTVSDAAVSAISGVIRNGAGTAVAGVSVGLYQGDILKKSATTNADGRYYFTELVAGAYVVRPAQTGHAFNPAHRAITVPPTVTNADFTISEVPVGSAISGVIRNGAGTAVANVSVGLYQGDVLSKSTTTGASGRYYFTELAAGGYVVRPSQTGNTFAPVHRAITVPPTVTNADFTISEVPTVSTISGVIKNGAGTAVASVSVGLYQGDVLKKSATTNADGRYYFTELAAGSYVVRAVQTGKTFDPAYRAVAVPPTVTNADFTISEVAAVSAISGVIRSGAGTAVASVSVGLYQGDVLKKSTTTNAEGRYYFTELAAGGYVVRPAQTGHTFSPAYRAITVPPTVTNADFTVTEAPTLSAISGVIRNAAGAGVAGISVGLYQGDVLAKGTSTNAEGRYYFTELANGTYIVRPAQTGKAFDPAQRSVTVPPTISIINFSMTEVPVTSAITGVIKNAGGLVMPGVSVGLYQGDVSRGTTVTNSDGRYYFTGLAAGTYVVRPGKANVVFDPLHRSVTVPPTNTTVNFIGTATEVGSAIAGQIKNGAGTPLQGISVGLYLHDALRNSATTNAEGRYAFTGLPAGTYVVRPAREGLLFDPLAKVVIAPPSTSIANFVGRSQPHPPVLSEGRVSPTTGNTRTLFTFSVIYTDAANREPGTAGLIMDGVKSYRMVKLDATDTNFADGCTFIYKLLLASGTHKFRFVFGAGGQVAMLPGPTSQEFFSGPTVTGESYYISGVIMVGTSRLEGVAVTVAGDGLEPVVVQTNAEGRFLASGLKPGVYTVVPVKTGYQFTPSSRTVTVPPGTSTCNFQGAVE